MGAVVSTVPVRRVRSEDSDQALADALLHAVHLDRAERDDDVLALAARARKRLARVLTLKGQAIVYGHRPAHPFDERLTIDLLFALSNELAAALLRPYQRATSPPVNLSLVACNARRAYEEIEERQGDPP